MSKSLDEAPEDTLRELSGPEGVLACRWCAKCDHHYRFCKCPEPKWMLRAEGKLGPLPGEAGGPVTLADVIAGKQIP